MATVKLQNGNVILKDGRASCSCCNCCMYYAQALANGLYTADDLPDEIELRQAQYIEIFTKSGNGYTGDLLGAPWTIELRSAPENPAIFNWAAVAQGGVANDAACLVGAYPKNDASTLTFGWDGWHTADRFADTYTISGPISGTVTRIARAPSGSGLFVGSIACEWVGDGLVLRYNGGFSTQASFAPVGSFKWSINGNAKSGFQNTPVGSYAGGYSVS